MLIADRPHPGFLAGGPGAGRAGRDTIKGMDLAALRIIDANLNRAGEGLRLLEEHARLVLGDEGLSSRAKVVRHGLAEIGKRFGVRELLAARDIGGDVGTGISTEAEQRRESTAEVAAAGAKRAAESMRCLEEYGKIIDAAAAQGVEQLRYEVYALEQGILIGGPRGETPGFGCCTPVQSVAPRCLG